MKSPFSKTHSPIDESNECSIPLANGLNLVAESENSNSSGTSYVRFVDKNGFERAYWESSEWEEDPECVMGAIIGVMNTEAKDIPNTH